MDITAIAIFGCVCWAIVRIVNGPSENPKLRKKAKATQTQLETEHAQMQEDLQAMAERLAVLEKIVTDEKYSLNRELEALKD
jgi:hypothetical protein